MDSTIISNGNKINIWINKEINQEIYFRENFFLYLIKEIYLYNN